MPLLNNITPVVEIPPTGSPLRGDAQVEFSVAEGGGKPDPGIQTKETDGYYSTNITLGTTEGRNRFNAIGTVTAAVPSWDAAGNITRTEKQLGAYFPIELWGLKINIKTPQIVFVNRDGYPIADTLFEYSILPNYYPQLSEQVVLEFYERDSSGKESYMGFVQSDNSGRLILSAGTAKFDTSKSYIAQVVLNRGTTAEVRSEKIRRKIYRNRDEARSDIFDYIEVFYNRVRRHSYLGQMSPYEYEIKATCGSL